MKISLPKSSFEMILNDCQNFLEKRDRSQITSHIYFKTQENQLQIKATDYEIWLETTIPVKCEAQGSATVNGSQIFGAIQRLKDTEITLETNQDKIYIRQDETKYKFDIFNADEFPQFPEYDSHAQINIQSDKFLHSIRKINPAIDTNNPKYELNGLLLDIKEYGFNFVATDTRRLALIEYKSQSVDTLSLIIPKKAINVIQKLFNEEFQIFHNQTHLILKNDRYTFYTKLISGKYPDYEKIIPKEFKHKIQLPKDQFVNALKLVNSIANNIKITISSNEIFFETLSEENAEASTKIKIQTSIVESFALGLNSKYILDFLSQTDSSEFTLCINEPNTPFVVNNDNFSTVIMPVIL